MSSGRTGVRSLARNPNRRREKLRLASVSLRGSIRWKASWAVRAFVLHRADVAATLAEWVKPIRAPQGVMERGAGGRFGADSLVPARRQRTSETGTVVGEGSSSPMGAGGRHPRCREAPRKGAPTRSRSKLAPANSSAIFLGSTSAKSGWAVGGLYTER